jgi:N-acetylglutamate synthase-like GNAT family acetyltransferase
MKNTITDYQPQLATVENIPALVEHNRRMFTEIWNLRSVPYDQQNLAVMDADYRTKLEKELVDGSCVAWVIKEKNQILASGSVSFVSMVPTPTDPQCRVAYVHSLFTENGFRRKGLSNRLMKVIVDYCHSQGIKRLILNTSQAGKGNYEKIGFKLADNSMRMHL